MQALTDNRTFVLAVAGLLIITAAGLKASRYIKQPASAAQPRFEQRIIRGLEHHNWKLVTRTDPLSHPEPYSKLVFTKSGCSQNLIVAIIGETDGLAPYLRSRFGKDIAYVQDGELVDEPDIALLQINRARNIGGSLWSTNGAQSFPIVALAPAPLAGEPSVKRCATPGAETWRRIYDNSFAFDVPA